MSEEIIYTSARKGLKPGSQGFCTVASTPGMAATMASLLESLSGYRHLGEPGSSEPGANPVVHSYLKARVGGRVVGVLSRISDAGLDYSGRNNKLAHHVAIRPQEMNAGGPAAAQLAPDFHERTFDSEPRLLSAGRQLPTTQTRPAACRLWQEISGDAGWGGVCAEYFSRPASGRQWVIVPAQVDALALLAEAIALLPAASRWDATYTTFFTKLPPGVDCRVRCVVAGTAEANEIRRRHELAVIDLTRPIGAPPDSRLVEAARTGIVPEVDPVGRQSEPVGAARSLAPDLEDLPGEIDLADAAANIPPPLPGARARTFAQRHGTGVPASESSRATRRRVVRIVAAAVLPLLIGVIAAVYLAWPLSRDVAETSSRPVESLGVEPWRDRAQPPKREFDDSKPGREIEIPTGSDTTGGEAQGAPDSAPVRDEHTGQEDPEPVDDDADISASEGDASPATSDEGDGATNDNRPRPSPFTGVPEVAPFPSEDRDDRNEVAIPLVSQIHPEDLEVEHYFPARADNSQLFLAPLKDSANVFTIREASGRDQEIAKIKLNSSKKTLTIERRPLAGYRTDNSKGAYFEDFEHSRIVLRDRKSGQSTSIVFVESKNVEINIPSSIGEIASQRPRELQMAGGKRELTDTHQYDICAPHLVPLSGSNRDQNPRPIYSEDLSAGYTLQLLLTTEIEQAVEPNSYRFWYGVCISKSTLCDVHSDEIRRWLSEYDSWQKLANSAEGRWLAQLTPSKLTPDFIEKHIARAATFDDYREQGQADQKLSKKQFKSLQEKLRTIDYRVSADYPPEFDRDKCLAAIERMAHARFEIVQILRSADSPAVDDPKLKYLPLYKIGPKSK